MGASNKSLKEALRARAAAEGFVACGVAAADAAPLAGERLRAWLAAGMHGDMLWMAARADERASPAALWPQVRSVVMLGMSYAPGDDPFAFSATPDRGRVSVYARGRDYHDEVKRALKRLAGWLAAEANDGAGAEVKVFVDTAPVMEKALAEAAGIGWQGKHSNVVSRVHGSWLFLGAIYTTIELGADLPPDERHPDNCGSCRRCQDVCPTDAFPAPYRLDARRCISYLTIEHRGPIAHDLRRGIGNHVYGCDDCLAVCPWNRFASAAAANKAFLPRAELVGPPLADLMSLSDAEFRALFAGSPIKRSGRERMVRNAAVAAGNSGDARLLGPLLPLLDDASATVRGAAIWALARLDPARFAAEREARQPHEPDAGVRAEWAGLCPVAAAGSPDQAM